MEEWERDDPWRQKLVDERCKTADEVVQWIVDNSGRYGRSGPAGRRPTPSTLSAIVYPEMAANAILVLIAVATSLLDRQVARLARDFEEQGGFTEKMYRVRSARKK
jgi:four helix bundle suffix protein